MIPIPGRFFDIPDDFTEQSDSPVVEIDRCNQALKYAWDRDLADLSPAEVLELASYKEHISHVLGTFLAFEIDVLRYLAALSTNGASLRLDDLQRYLAEEYELDMAECNLDPEVAPSADEIFAKIDELLLASEIVTTGMVPYYTMIVNRETSRAEIVNPRANTPGRRFNSPQYHYAFKMILNEMISKEVVVE